MQIRLVMRTHKYTMAAGDSYGGWGTSYKDVVHEYKKPVLQYRDGDMDRWKDVEVVDEEEVEDEYNVQS